MHITRIGRVVGETAAVVYTAGTVYKIPKGIMSNARTLSVHLWILAKEGISFEQAFATACILVIIVAVINFITNRLTKSITKARMG